MTKRLARPFSALLLATLFTTVVFSPNTNAQTLDKDKMAAVLVIINSFLLEEEVRSIDLVLNDYDAQIKTITETFDAVLDTQGQDVEFCFYLSANQTLPSANFNLEINGVPQTGVNQPIAGENCYSIPISQQRAQNVVNIEVENNLIARISAIGIEPANQTSLGLPSLTRSSWDERAVRKVLKIFAFGGHATDAQIVTWANMRPRLAIQEMLNFDQHNLKLSPLAPGESYTEPAIRYGEMGEFYQYIESTSSNHPIPINDRQYLGVDGYRFASTFGRMIAMRGLNPFRQKIGFWETNYHLATNLSAGVSRKQMVRYYDDIMRAHEQRLPYHQIMGVAAKSAAVAMQYGHRNNRCRNSYIDRNTGQCRTYLIDGELKCEFQGNADFAREIHQLFFGIFGEGDPNHEDVTIENSARMLSGMRLEYIEDFGFSTEVEFQTCGHYEDKFGPLRILGQNISGPDAATKIDQLMPISISHPESRKNLPVSIISTLADDSLTEAKREQLRAAWDQLGDNKDFLTFIHAYAISAMHHGTDHVKYSTSFDRAYYLANKTNIDNIEAFLSNDYERDRGRAGRRIDDVLSGDNAGEAFRPLHNVFGGQTSQEASDSSVAFEKNYNRSATDADWNFSSNMPSSCEGCDQGQPWLKDWSKVIPPRDGGYRADYVAQWLWRHVVGNMDNYTELERTHLLSMLGAIRQPRADGTEPPWQIDRRYPFFDINVLLCIRADRIDNNENNNSLENLMRYESWDRRCRHSNNVYAPHERSALDFTFNGDQLKNSGVDPFPYLRGLTNELSSVDIGLTSTNPRERRRANERVQAALAFIFATPFVFAEGQ